MKTEVGMWLRHPVTKLFMQDITEQAADIAEQLAALFEFTTGDTQELVRIQRLQGRLMALRELLDKERLSDLITNSEVEKHEDEVEGLRT